MKHIDPIELTRSLIRFDTVNPPGHEAECAHYLAGILADAGFEVALHAFAPGRTSVVASLAGSGDEPPLAMTGHLDTVPFGAAPWNWEPLAAEIDGDKLYGRGASDMKSGVAVLVACAAGIAGAGVRPARGLVLVLTAGEETGCDGARHLAEIAGLPGRASGLLVAEPTSNYPAIGHRGALWMRGRASGVTAHGSMPERGINAVYKAARAIAKLEDFGFNQRRDELLGGPSLNVGTVSGGMNVNSVPDRAEFSIDVRTIDRGGHAGILAQLASYLGPEVELSPFVDLEPVKAQIDDPFVQSVFSVMADVLGEPISPRTLPFFTDASILGTAMSGTAVIVGPGETAMAHKTDEYCYVSRIPEALEAYTLIVRLWCGC
jgi:succinyl-diaminopimelate desuccinylase